MRFAAVVLGALASACTPAPAPTTVGQPGTTAPATTIGQPAEPAICRPAPFSAAIEVVQIPAGNLSALQMQREWMVVMPRADCGASELPNLASRLRQCLQTPCGARMSVPALKSLDAELAKVPSLNVMLGGHLARAMATDRATYVAFPRDAPVDTMVTAIATQQPISGAATVPCCPGCAPCDRGQCGSVPPVQPRGTVGVVDQRCNCEAIYPQYCPHHPADPPAPGSCECADACCSH